MATRPTDADQSPGGATSTAAPRVRIRGLSKSFPGTVALDDVSLDIRPGEIRALVGGNGSGKSTLIKILCGVHQGDPGGTIEIGGVTLAAEDSSPDSARRHGVRVVHQDLGVFLDLSVAENLALGSRYERTWLGGVSWSRLQARATALAERFEIDADPRTELRRLGPGVRTQVAIARALQDQDETSAGLLILDEPTASLPEHEVQMLLSHLRRYAAGGQSILYVSHRLDEILALADSVSALRDGRLAGTHPVSEITEDRLVDLIVGRPVERLARGAAVPSDAEALFQVSGLCVGPVRDAAFTVRRGEIVGIGGLLGSGRSEILRTIFGEQPRAAGTLTLRGAPYAPASAAEAIRAGVAHVPENRLHDAVFGDVSIAGNLAMPSLRSYWRGGRMADGQIRRDAADAIDRFLVKAPDPGALLATLSGGNQQKVVMARWLRRNPDLLLLDEPTQGVDVGARADIYELVRAATARGAGAIVVASDFEELAAVCDRVLVLRAGRVAEELHGNGITAHRITEAVHGVSGTRQGEELQ